MKGKHVAIGCGSVIVIAIIAMIAYLLVTAGVIRIPGLTGTTGIKDATQEGRAMSVRENVNGTYTMYFDNDPTSAYCTADEGIKKQLDEVNKMILDPHQRAPISAARYASLDVGTTEGSNWGNGCPKEAVGISVYRLTYFVIKDASLSVPVLQ